VRVWNVGEAKVDFALEGHKDWVTCVAFSGDGQKLASSSFDRTVRLWSVGEKKELKSLAGHKGTVWSVAFSKDGATLASGAQDGVKLWDVAKGEERAVK
jgi:WD40 repeat protein